MVGAGARRTVKLTLPTSLRKSLDANGTLRLKVTATVRDLAGNKRTVSKVLRPKLRPSG